VLRWLGANRKENFTLHSLSLLTQVLRWLGANRKENFTLHSLSLLTQVLRWLGANRKENFTLHSLSLLTQVLRWLGANRKASAKRSKVFVQHRACQTKRSVNGHSPKQCLTKYWTMETYLKSKLGEAAKQWNKFFRHHVGWKCLIV